MHSLQKEQWEYIEMNEKAFYKVSTWFWPMKKTNLLLWICCRSMWCLLCVFYGHRIVMKLLLLCALLFLAAFSLQCSYVIWLIIAECSSTERMEEKEDSKGAKEKWRAEEEKSNEMRPQRSKLQQDLCRLCADFSLQLWSHGSKRRNVILQFMILLTLNLIWPLNKI